MGTCSVCKGGVHDAARCCGTCAKLVEAIKQVIAREEKRELVQQRKNKNVLNPPRTFMPEVFWKQMVDCLCTSNQRVDDDKPVPRFLKLDPFPLSLLRCKEQEQSTLESYARQKIQRAGVNYSNQIAGRLVWNLNWLENSGGWSKVEGQFELLAGIPPRSPNAADCIATAEKDKEIEREAAHVAMKMKGIGPKQSRNLWICLGLTRYETPLDSRVMKWFKERQAPFIGKKNLSSSKDYEEIENCIQSLCKEANEFPCVFDAAAFISEEKPAKAAKKAAE
jgi:hypothetical protein